jgi:hypothetical protein
MPIVEYVGVVVRATRRAAVTPKRQGSSHVEFPNDLEIVLTREFEAPIALVFDVLTKPEHVGGP